MKYSKSLIKTYFILLVLFLLSINSFSQSSDYKFKNLTIKDGLSQNSVTNIYQDHLGKMWFATRNGLNSFDGSEFKIYRNSPSDSTSIGHNDLTSIIEDSEGIMWVGTYRGLNKFDPITNTFTEYLNNNSDGTINYNVIRCLKEIKDEIWIGTSNGVSIFNKKTKTFITTSHNPKDPKSISSNRIRKIINTKDGTIWIGTEKGLNKVVLRDKNRFEFEYYGADYNEKSWYVQDIVEDFEKNIWIGTKFNGLFKLQSETERIISISDLAKFNEVDRNIRVLVFDDSNKLWIGTFKGLSILNTDGHLYNVEVSNKQNSFLSKSKSIYLDKKGSMWIGSSFGGVSVSDYSFNNFNNLDTNNLSGALNSNIVSSIVSDKKNNIFIGTQGGGVNILDINTGGISFFDQDNKLGLANITVKSLCYSNENELWIGTLGGGIYVVDIDSEKLIKGKISRELQQLLVQKEIHSIYQESKDIMWIGTYGNGLLRYNLQNKKFKVFKKKDNDSIALSNNRVRTILLDASNRMWVGTQKGLNSFNLEDLKNDEVDMNHFFYESKINSGFEILSIFEDSFRNIWVGTYQNGLYLLKEDTFEKVKIKGVDKDLTLINSILEDDLKNLWIKTNNGIVKFNINTGDARLFDQTSTSITSEFSNSAYNFISEKFFFGGGTGVTYFDPHKIIINEYAPKVLFTELKVKNEIVIPNSKDGLLNKSIAQTKKITLPYDQSSFSIQFAIPNFINSFDNKYAYRLRGLEDEFIISKNNQVNYIIQNPGTYTFEVKGANNDGIWNNDITSLEIVVKPAPWRSAWAFLAYGLLILILLFGLINFSNTRTKLEHELELEHLEKDRITELNNLEKEGIKKVNNEKLQFFTNISHEFRTPLTLILAPIEQLLANYKGSVEMYKNLQIVDYNAKHLFKLINRLMDFRKFETKHFKLEASKGNLVEFVQEIYMSFSEYAKDGNYSYVFKTSHQEINVYYDQPKLERVFNNLISNAFKYTPKGGVIQIELKKGNKYVDIKVDDTGVGIAKENIDKIFERFFEISINNNPQEIYQKGTGIGLSIANNIVKLHKGKIKVRNKKTKGVVFEVALPLGKGHLTSEEIANKIYNGDELTHYESQLLKPENILVEDVNDRVVQENKATILIVEDNKPLRMFIKTLLHSDYNIIEAENGKIGFNKALKNAPNLIISDVKMPEMEGTELCEKIKQDIRTSHIPVILLTARTSLVHKFKGLESGADDYIGKPFIIKEFELKINNILESTQRLRNKFSNENNFVPSEITLTSVDEKLLKKAFKIVEDNISNDAFDTNLFSSELGLSRTMLFTKIKAWTNFTPNEFILEIRMKRATKLLEQNKISISEICYYVGYQNPTYFRQIFKKKFGKSPSQYQSKFFRT